MGECVDGNDVPDGRTWLLIADVTGEGVAAALLMANLQAAVRVSIDSSEDPAELMTRWNRLIYQNTDSSKFVTALLGLLDPAGQKAVFTTAGHFRPFIIRPDGSAPMEVPLKADFPLGVIEDAKYESPVV